MPVQLYYFRTPDLGTGKMRKARYVTDLETIQRRYPKYEIIGPAEVLDDCVMRPHSFSSGWNERPRRPAPPLSNVEINPVLRTGEAALVCIFLRRYVTWCARAKRYAAMEGAAILHRSLGGSSQPRLEIAGIASSGRRADDAYP